MTLGAWLSATNSTVEVTKDSCSVSGRTPEQINAATEAALLLLKEMQEMSREKRRKKPVRQKGSD